MIQKLGPRARLLIGGLSLLLIVLILGIAALRARAQAGQGVLGGTGQRGISFVPRADAPFGAAESLESLKRLHDTGANWVAVVVPFHQSVARSTNFYRTAGDPADEAIGQIIGNAHTLGMHVMLQPVVQAEQDGVWSGYFSPESVDEWFSNYREMISAYARLAQNTQADEFCIGTEFFLLTKPQYSGQWRQIIATVRQNYFGPITYSANWGDKKTPEYATIDWWDAMDYIGISAYFPLSWNDFYTQPLAQGWFGYRDPFGDKAIGEQFHWFDAIAAVHGRWNKPVQFTRIGFASYANSPGRWDVTPDPYLELSVQANGIDATMQVWGAVDWMTGIFWGPWYSQPNAGGPTDNGDSPQNKPGQDMLHKWYTP